MIEQGFYIEKEIPEKWWTMVFYNIETEEELSKVFGSLLAFGLSVEDANNAIKLLVNPNTGYIISNENLSMSIILISKATSFDEMFNTVTHEIKHLSEHICSKFGYDSKSEKAAYIQGEIGQNMYKAVAIAVCPKCNCKNH